MADALTTTTIDCSNSTQDEICQTLNDLIQELDGFDAQDWDGVLDGHVSSVIVSFDENNRPAPGTEGRILFQTDTLEILRDNGSSWVEFGGSGIADTRGLYWARRF